jgi:hypothetical protein
MQTCRACDAELIDDARFCARCGQRVVADEAPEQASASADFAAEFDSRDNQRIAREMFQAHIELLRRYRLRVRELDRRADTISERLTVAEESPPSPQNAKLAQDLLEELENVGDAWDDLQRSYNADSETLDEEFLDRMSEMELDVELPDRMQAQIIEEHEGMTEGLEELSETLRQLGDRGARVIGRASGRWTGAAKSASGGAWGWALAATAFTLLGVFTASPFVGDLGWSWALLVGAGAGGFVAIWARARAQG